MDGMNITNWTKPSDYLTSDTLGGLSSKIADETLELVEKTSDPEVMDELSDSLDWRIRSRIAKKPNIKPETLEKLSKDRDYLVRISVTHNEKVSMKMLQVLTNDTDTLVKKCAKLALELKKDELYQMWRE
jgi:hypothetical protein